MSYTFCGRCGRKVWIGNTEPIKRSRRRICIFCLAEQLRDEGERDERINLDRLIQDLPPINKAYSHW